MLVELLELCAKLRLVDVESAEKLGDFVVVEFRPEIITGEEV